MAPEVYATAVNKCTGYSFAADWWSLGICVYELMRGRPPYDVNNVSDYGQIHRRIVNTQYTVSSEWCTELSSFVQSLLTVNPVQRVHDLTTFRACAYVSRVKYTHVLRKMITPIFVPNMGSLNCDPVGDGGDIEARISRRKKQNASKVGGWGMLYYSVYQHKMNSENTWK
jgi:serine/threonine kinase 32